MDMVVQLKLSTTTKRTSPTQLKKGVIGEAQPAQRKHWSGIKLSPKKDAMKTHKRGDNK